VRHHVKKKKGDARSNAFKKDQEEKKKLEEDLENLDRFAGSSDEEDDTDASDVGDDDDDDGDDHQEMVGDGAEDGRDQSSNSEDSEDDYDDVYREEMKSAKGGVEQRKNPVKAMDDANKEEEDGNSSENDYNDEERSDDDDEMVPTGPRDAKSLGMANAMSRILGGGGQSMFMPPPSSSEDADKDATSISRATNNNKPVILSKTITPLQRLQQKIRTEERALRTKRQNRRAENLSAMRLPLAPTAEMSAERLWKQKKKKKVSSGSEKKRGSSEWDDEENGGSGNDDAVAVVAEIEAERTHRRIATRGVVALFNAISKHRAAVAAEVTEREEEKRRIREEGRALGRAKRGGDNGDSSEGAKSKTKHGFLDMIKKSAASTSTTGTSGAGELQHAGANGARRANGPHDSKGKLSSKGSEKSVGWSALKDDFMMNSKLKDWDKEISDDEDDDDVRNGYEKVEAVAPETAGQKKRGGKRQRV